MFCTVMIRNAEECDATGGDSSTAAWFINKNPAIQRDAKKRCLFLITVHTILSRYPGNVFFYLLYLVNDLRGGRF